MASSSSSSSFFSIAALVIVIASAEIGADSGDRNVFAVSSFVVPDAAADAGSGVDSALSAPASLLPAGVVAFDGVTSPSLEFLRNRLKNMFIRKQSSFLSAQL